MAAHTQTHAPGHGDHDDHEHGLAHVASKKILLGVGATLLFLTIITVAATKVDFGGQMNLVVALLIATVKATLVAMFFMHLRYDKPFHTVVIAGALLAALLFVGFAFMDGNQYQVDVCEEPGANCVTWQDAIVAHEAAEAERAVPSSDPSQPSPAGGAEPAPAADPGKPAPDPAAATPAAPAADPAAPVPTDSTEPAPGAAPAEPAAPAQP